MNVLSIGNSFSNDLQRYFHKIAELNGIPLFNVNLMIGGCSLERHYNNMKNDLREYGLEVFGESTGFMVSLKEALSSREWDVITLQQVSHLSAFEDSYHPYIDELCSYVRKLSPTAKIYIHQTWGYEDGSDMLRNVGFKSFEEMSQAVRESYVKAARSISADGIIPSGEVMLDLFKNGERNLHRDTFHAGLGLARYALALSFAEIILGIDARRDTLSTFDVEVSPEQIRLARRVANEVCALYRN